MGISELILLAVGLAMDAFAVSVCKGLSMEKVSWKSMAVVGLWFGLFQGVMPVLGWLLGSAFEKYIAAFDHWIIFFLLVLIGVNMIREALDPEDEPVDASLDFRPMLALAIATSIDALAVGVTFAFLPVSVLLAALMIAGITFAICAFGVRIGSRVGARYQNRAEFAGGVILILLGLKILLEHLGILAF